MKVSTVCTCFVVLGLVGLLGGILDKLGSALDIDFSFVSWGVQKVFNSGFETAQSLAQMILDAGLNLIGN